MTKKILIPIDLTDDARAAFYEGLALANKIGTETYILYVSEPIRSFDFGKKKYVETHDTIEKVEEGFHRRIDELWESGGLENIDRRKVHLIIRGGKPAKEIIETAAHHDIDLIVMGSGSGSQPVGATTDRVLRTASCSVLLVRS